MAEHTENLDVAEGVDHQATEAAAGHGAEVAKGAEAVEHAQGMPQLDFSTFPNQIFWLCVALLATYLILSRVALPRIAAVLAERQGTITNDVAAAEELKGRAAEAEKAYEKALADARAEAGRIADEAKAEMQAEVKAAMAEADKEIAQRTEASEARIAEIRAATPGAVREVALDTAKAVVAALGLEVQDSVVEAAVEKRVRQ